MIICRSCQEENPSKFRLCGYCGALLHEEAATTAPPMPNREVRRTVTIVFCDLKDSTSLGERLDAEALREAKEHYFTAMAMEITRHGGKVEKYIGDALMAVFGLPVQHENDALRAVRAAAGMQAALLVVNAKLRQTYGIELANRTGVNTGEVVATDDPTADQKLATGDAVNVAARLEQAAPVNEVYIGESTWHLVRDAVQVEPVEPLELKGKRERVPAFRLVSASGHDGKAPRHDTPIVGRDDELRSISQVLQEVSETGSARLITLLGDAGIGKSRLAEEAVSRVGESARVVRGRCLSYGDGITFWPLRGIVSEAAGIAVEDSPEIAFHKVMRVVGDAEVAQRLASAIGLSDGAYPLHETSWATRKFFATLAQSRSVVALVDDIHWAEPAFLDLLETVLRADATAPILLLCTARNELLEKRADWSEGERALRLMLRPLSPAAAASVARNVLGRSNLSREVATRIVEAAEGNPLYVEHMLSMLVESQKLKLREGRWAFAHDEAEITVPPTIKALLEARIGRLRIEERSAIEPASVIGLQFPVPAVASMTPERFRPTIEQHLIALSQKQLVTAVPEADEGLVYKFHHQLVRDTIYHGLLKRTRATLHVEFVRWADRVNAYRGRSLEFEEILGYHLEQAQRYLRELGPLDEKGEAIGRDATRRLSSAGRRAFARGDLRAAANLLRRALVLCGDGDPLRIPLLPELAEVLLEAGQFDDARALVEEAIRTADPQRDRRVTASAEVVRLLLLRLHGGEAIDWAESAESLMHHTIPALVLEGAHAEVAKAWRFVAQVQQSAGRIGEAAGSIAKVVEHARLAGDQRLVARGSLGLVVSAVYGPTPVPEALAQCEALIADDLADRQVQNLIVCKIAQLHAMSGSCDRAREICRRARTVLRDLGRGVRAAAASIDLASVEMLAGDPAAAERELRPDCEMLEKMGETFFLSSMLVTLACAVREQGRDEEALEITRLAESKAALEDIEAQVLWRCVRGPILARAGAHEEAEGLVRASLEMAKQTELPYLRASAWSELASVLRLRGETNAARQALDEALKIYEAKGDRMSPQRLSAAHARL